MIKQKSDYWLLFALVVSLIATFGSLYFSEIMHYLPCELCWFQRIFMYPLPILLGIAYYRRDLAIVPYLFPFVALGGAFSLYHSILQKVPPKSDIVACGRTPCQGDYLNWFGWLTIPMLAFAAFVMITYALLKLQRNPNV
jgi:disulfide bond formation protein DsbB